MTVQNTTRFIRANGDGAVVAFQFSFPTKLTTDVTVKKIVNSTGIATTQIVDVDYTITLDTVTEGGTVTYIVAPTALEDSFITRETTQDQQTGLPIGGNFPEISVENEIDRSRMIDIELQEQIGRCIIISDTESLTGINAPMGSNAANRASKVWAWDSDGLLLTLRAGDVGGGLTDLVDDTTPQLGGDLDLNGHKITALPVTLAIAISDETTALTTGTAKATFRMPHAMILTEVRSSVTTAPTGATLVIDINETGSTVLSTKLSIDISEKTSTTATTPAVISDTDLANDAEIAIDIDQIGSTIAGAGAKVYLIGVRA